MPIVTNSKIDLISKALILCGEPPLNSLSDNRYGATVGANLFELLFENELQSNRWRFAMKKGALSQLVDAPLNEWRNAYQLPTDMLLPIGIFPANTPYEIYADHLYTNAASVEMDYMFKPDITRCPAYFCMLMTYALARDMIKPITESDTSLQLMERKYTRQRERAQYADAQGRPARPIYSSPFTDVR
jgi:hypothetical protein